MGGAGIVTVMDPTAEQAECVDLFTSGLNLVIQAGAGTGKSSTLRMMAQSTPRVGQLVSFNKAVANDAAKSMPSTVRSNTAHSLAFRAVGRRYQHRLGGARMRSMDVARLLKVDPMVVDYDGAKKVLQPSYLASLAMRAVANFCFSDAPEPSSAFVPYIPGIDPANEYGRGWANNQLVRHHLEPAIKLAWADQCDPAGRLKFTHDGYLKMWQLAGPVIDADYVLLDECFPAGTLVETTRGPMPIEKIAESPDETWEVLSYDFEGRTLCSSCVTASYQSQRRGPLVRIHTDAGSLTATANHPIWVVDRGWVPAGLVADGDTVSHLWPTDGGGMQDLLARVPLSDADSQSATGAGMPGLREGDSERWSPRQERDVFTVVREEVRGSEYAAGAGGRAPTQDFGADEGRQDGDSQPYGEPGDEGEGVRDAETDRSPSVRAGRERQGADPAPGGAVRSADGSLRSWALAPRACRPVWKQAGAGWAEPAPLEVGSGGTGADDRGGGGRTVTQLAEAAGAGSTQDVGLGTARVVRVEVLESGGSGGSDDGGENGDDCVYTLSVATTGCYFADGVLVKNCQDSSPVLLSIFDQQTDLQRVACGDSSQQLYAWRGAVDALSMIDADAECFLSNSFRFGPAIAAVANKLLTMLDAPLRLVGLESIDSRVEAVERPDCILCRTNAVAMRTVLRLLAQGRRVHLVGGGEEIVRFARAAQQLRTEGYSTHPDLACFTSWGEVVDWVEQDPAGDELALLVKLVEEFGTEAIVEGLEATTPEELAEVIVSTAHRGKGREWSTVALAEDFPEFRGEPAAEELRLLYVACTRAKHVLDVTGCAPMRTLLGEPAARPVLLQA